MANSTLGSWLNEGPYTLALSSSFFGFYAHGGAAAALYGKLPAPSKIAGSSAGALVGGALASSLSPADIRDLFFGVRKEHFWDPAPGPGLLRGKKFLTLLESNLVPTFQRTKIPFEATVFDLFSLRTRFLREGSLPKAVAASCAVPLLFRPVRIGTRLYLDGGVFHKSGINLDRPKERILCIFIQQSGLADSYEWGHGLRNLGPNQKVLRLRDLPSVTYDSLESGREAFAEAKRRVAAALKFELKGPILDG
ncbi:MAG: patatin-like phospholipase family protein [Bdellovibrionota bacterium]